MNKREKQTLIWAINELMQDDGNFNEAVSKLCRLVGKIYPAGEILSKNLPHVSFPQIRKESEFKVNK